MSSMFISSLENVTVTSSSSILFATEQSGTNYYVGRQASTALSQISWILFLSRQYFIIKRSSETSLSDIYWVLYRSGTKSNTKRQILTALSIILWVLKHSGRNCILELQVLTAYHIIAYFMNVRAIRDRFWRMKIITNKFITHFIILVAVRNKL